MSAHGRGRWVCIPKDFLDLGSREAVDQALSRLVKAGQLRRVSHGLYDMPRMSDVLKRPAPVDLDAAIAALARRDGVRIMPDGLAAANQLGLTNALPAKASYVTDALLERSRSTDERSEFRHARPSVMQWAGKPSAPVVQALRWLGPEAAADAQVVSILSRHASRRGEARSVPKQPASARLGAASWHAASRLIRPLPYESDLRDFLHPFGARQSALRMVIERDYGTELCRA